MVIDEMTEAECRQVLVGKRVAHLACALNNQPYVVPTSVDLDGEFLYGYATLGQKIEWMRQNPLVCLAVNEFTPDGDWVSVIVTGHYEELPHTPEYEDSRRTAERLFHKQAMWWEPASVPLTHHGQRTRIVFRIRMDRMTGRRATSGAGSGEHAPNPPQPSPARSLTQFIRGLLGRS